MTDEQLKELLSTARSWFRMVEEILQDQSGTQLAHRDELEAALKLLQEWNQAENRTADANAKARDEEWQRMKNTLEVEAVLRVRKDVL